MASFAIPQGSECPYWSHGDESAFFRWLETIPGVKSVKGQGLELPFNGGGILSLRVRIDSYVSAVRHRLFRMQARLSF
jgi:hypothetical protein